MRSVKVSLRDRSYPIVVGHGLLRDIARHLKRVRVSADCVLIVTQRQIGVHYLSPLTSALSAQGFLTESFITPAGKSSESSKTHATFLKLVKKIAALSGKNKSLLLVALGGGVIGDLAGFAASVYRRGIPYVQLPTTITGQVDSAIGGKTGIDLPQGKNLMGTIYQPKLVLNDLDLLNTLDERHWSDGFAEIIKYGMIRDTRLFGLLEKNTLISLRGHAKHLEQVIFRCAQIKADVVRADEWDKRGKRIFLNFGHTAGHAIEAASGYSRNYTHGESVAIGMLVACEISKTLGVLKDETLIERLQQLLMKYNLPLSFRGLKIASILNAMGHDKKSEGGTNRFVLPVNLGKMEVVKDVPEETIRQALLRYKR